MTPQLLFDLSLLFAVEAVEQEDDADVGRLLDISDELGKRASEASRAAAPAESGVFKVCTGCGAGLTEEQWGGMPLCGYMRNMGDEPDLELRTHGVCGSTIAIEVA